MAGVPDFCRGSENFGRTRAVRGVRFYCGDRSGTSCPGEKTFGCGLGSLQQDAGIREKDRGSLRISAGPMKTGPMRSVAPAIEKGACNAKDSSATVGKCR